MSKRQRFEPVEESDAESEENEEEEEEEDEDEDEEDEDEDEDDNSDSDLSDVPPVLRSIVTKGEVGSSQQNEDAEREAIKQELSSLSFEELQKLKQKLGSKKFEQTLKGKTKKPPVEEEDNETKFKRANKNRPREMSSKIRRVEIKKAIQVPKVFKSDPRFDSMCGEFNEKKFNRNYEFVSKIKEEELTKLKEDIKEEKNPRQIEKMKYLIQRMENQIRSEKKRKEEEEKQAEERQAQIEALNKGINPYFTSKTTKKKEQLKEKFEKLKKDGKLESYMSKKRKHNAQRDRKFLPNANK